MRIDSDDPAVTAALTRLRETVQVGGGAFHPDMTVIARGGDLAVTVPPGTDSDERLIQVPAACLPDLDGIAIGLDGEALVVERDSSDQPATARAALDGLLELYNACNKAALWRAACPWLALARDPEVLAGLADLRAANPKVRAYRDMVGQGQWDELLVDSFLGTRMFRLKPAAESGSGADAGAPTPVLLPIVECLNHHFDGRPYQTTVDDDGVYRLWAHADRPLWNSDECFVLYTLLDPVDSLLFYGFVDDSAPVLHSCPATLELPENITITVRAEPWSLHQGELPAMLQDIRVFVPPIAARDGQHVTLPWVLVPGAKTPWALRRMLRAYVYALRPDLADTSRREIVDAAEMQLLAANHDALDALADRVGAARDARPPDPPAGRDAALDSLDGALAGARQRLDAYAERLAIDPP